MKAKLIYTEGSSYYWGRNPYNEKWTRIIEFDGKYYKLYTWGNHTNEGEIIYEVDFDPQNMPEEYERDDGTTEYSLRHGNGRIINIDLTKRDSDVGLPEELKSLYDKEVEELNQKRIQEDIERYPELNYKAVLEQDGLTDEEKEIIKELNDYIEAGMYGSKSLHLTDFKQVIENLVPIAKGEAVIEVYNGSLINNKKIKEGAAFSLTRWNHGYESSWKSAYAQVFSLQGKKIKLKDGRQYFGSYGGDGWCTDIILDRSGNPYAVFHNYIDVNLPVERFNIRTGDYEDFEDYNAEVKVKRQELREIKKEKIKYYQGVMQDIQETFGISREEAKEALKHAGSVTALEKTMELADAGVSERELKAILRKISYDGVNSISKKVRNLFDVNLAVFQGSAASLKYIDEVLGGEAERNKKVGYIPEGTITLGEIAHIIDNRNKKNEKEDVLLKDFKIDSVTQDEEER